MKVNKIRISIPKKNFQGKKNPKRGKKTKPSQRKCCEGNKKSNLHIKNLRERNFYSDFTMNVRFFLPSQYFGVKFHVKNVGLTGLTETAWSHVNLTLYNYVYNIKIYRLISYLKN